MLEDGKIGVGVLPEGEEILIGFAGVGAGSVGVGTLRGLGFEGVGTSEAQTRKRALGLVNDYATMVDDFLKFRRCGASLFCCRYAWPLR